MRFCPICQKKSDKFLSFGLNLREDAMCPFCNSLERDRLAYLYLSKETSFFTKEKQNMLHVAPEKILAQVFQSTIGNGYMSVDIEKNRAMVEMDITEIKFANNKFDAIYCSHVLEHIVEDEKAMKELCRVLKDDGWAILNVPIMTEGKTFEDYTIIEADERMKIYGDPLHVRNYGNDYKDRLTQNGFNVSIIIAKNFLSSSEIINMGITSAAGEIYFCNKELS